MAASHYFSDRPPVACTGATIARPSERIVLYNVDCQRRPCAAKRADVPEVGIGEGSIADGKHHNTPGFRQKLFIIHPDYHLTAWRAVLGRSSARSTMSVKEPVQRMLCGATYLEGLSPGRRRALMAHAADATHCGGDGDGGWQPSHSTAGADADRLDHLESAVSSLWAMLADFEVLVHQAVAENAELAAQLQRAQQVRAPRRRVRKPLGRA